MKKMAKNSIFRVTLGFLIILLLSCQKPSSTDIEKVVHTDTKNAPQSSAETHADRQTTQQPIGIISPIDGSRVCMENLVRGSISDPGLQVYVLIHPMSTSRFWVQQIPERGSNWQTLGRFGEPDIGIGQYFEVIAVASRNRNLFREGQEVPAPLQDNPSIILRSRPIVVIRDPCLH